ncbi:unnamed protein product [Closterium sp. Yama58-4]|nr:unnamed protein product [Closterium sp. Yama58-4]
MADEGFDARKAAVLAALASAERDKSLKGGLDAPIADLVAEINGHDDLFTTSSHDPIDPADLVTAVFSTSTARTDADGSNSASSISTPATPAICASPRALPGELVFRFEPLILALECRSLTAAQALVSCAIRAGFRESGFRCSLAAAQALVSCAIRAGFRESAAHPRPRMSLPLRRTGSRVLRHCAGFRESGEGLGLRGLVLRGLGLRGGIKGFGIKGFGIKGFGIKGFRIKGFGIGGFPLSPPFPPFPLPPLPLLYHRCPFPFLPPTAAPPPRHR